MRDTRTPLERMIDKATGYEPSAAQVRSSELVVLRCPKCKREMSAKKEPTDPPETAVVELHCPECLNGGWEQITYYDKAGKEIAQHNNRI